MSLTVFHYPDVILPGNVFQRIGALNWVQQQRNTYRSNIFFQFGDKK